MTTDLITPGFWEDALSWLAMLAWVIALTGSMARVAWVGFTRYPWPEWARLRRRDTARQGENRAAAA